MLWRMADLKFDTAALAVSRTHVDRARDVISRTSESADQLAGAVGHDGLAQTVRSFASKWTISRTRLAEHLLFISDVLHAIEQTMEDLEREMARNARELGEATDAASR